MRKSIWAHVFGFSGRKKHGYKNLINTRSLRMEPLEQRQLLSIETAISHRDGHFAGRAGRSALDGGRWRGR